MSSQVFATNKMFTTNKVSVLEGSIKLIEKFAEPKTRKLSKSKRFFKSRKALIKLIAFDVSDTLP